MERPLFGSTDGDLIASLLQDDLIARKAENAFFSRYDYFIKEGIKKYRLSEDEAFDAYSDTILVVVENIRKGSFEGRSSLKTYTFQVFQNKCVDLIRKKTTNKNSVHQTGIISGFMLEFSDTTKSILQRLTEKADWNLLKEKLNSLGDKCREMLMFFASGHSDKELAQALGYKTADVVKTSRLRCLEKLRQEYKNEISS
jgi:RNA polymerase sigma factor (sigma-70 family)